MAFLRSDTLRWWVVLLLVALWPPPSREQVLQEGTSEKGCTNQFGQAVACPDTIWPPDIPLPPGCDAAHIGRCTMTPDHCGNMAGLGGEYHIAQGGDGKQYCVPARTPPSCPNIPIDNPGFASPDCHVFPINPKNSIDPNDKVATFGATDSGFVATTTPLRYVVHFENLATATGPAQVVVVTDQLDPAKVDLATFQLGPMTVGDNIALVPPPGLQTFTGGVDLRPDQDVILTVSAGLDRNTGFVAWRFTSIDPYTGQLTDNPDAGFLPPNTNPPTGEGSVAFTVMPKNGLTTGTAIQNQALVVFDANGAIATRTVLNTIDRDAPTTRVLPLSATQASPSVTVQWSGSDVGSGIGAYTVFVSDNGGAFRIWLDSTRATSASYPGQLGHGYGFFALGRDLVGNVEAMKSAAEATTQIASGPACASDVSGQIQVTRSGFGYNLVTQRFVQTVTLKNTSMTLLAGPLSLVLDTLSSNATLFNAGGITACAAPAGDPYINVASGLAPGASASIVLQFVNPTRAGISYVTRILSGSAGR